MGPRPRHLPEQPLQHLNAPAQVGRQEAAGLLAEIQQDGAGFEHADRLRRRPAGSSSTIAGMRLLGEIAQELGLNCSPLPMLTGYDAIGRGCASSRKIVILWPFGVVQ